VKQGWAGAVKKKYINNTIWNVAPSTILFCFYLVPGYVVEYRFFFVTEKEQLQDVNTVVVI
jgi:hypothetical protein